MKWLVGSDWHLEHDRDGGAAFLAALGSTGFDGLIVAGDLCVSGMFSKVLPALCAKFPTVVYTLGNHETYGGNARIAWAPIKAWARKLGNLVLLDREVVDVQGVRFAGCTLWADPTYVPAHARHGLDLQYMVDPLTWMPWEHNLDVSFLQQNAHRVDVVVTHVAPHAHCTVSRFVGDPCNWYFTVEEMGPTVETCGAALWVHGHHHDPGDQRIGTTRVLCNPRGYPGDGRRKRYHLVEVEIQPRSRP